jgi:hypothetical protein
MEPTVSTAITAVDIDSEAVRKQWFELICQTYDRLDRSGQLEWRQFTVSLTEQAEVDGIDRRIVEQFIRHLDLDDFTAVQTIEQMRELSDDLPIIYGQLVADTAAGDPHPAEPVASGEDYDEERWNAFLAEHGPRWDGGDSSWDQFQIWFAYQADQAGLGTPAAGFLAHAENQPDKHAVFAEYGLPIDTAEHSPVGQLSDDGQWRWDGENWESVSTTAVGATVAAGAEQLWLSDQLTQDVRATRSTRGFDKDLSKDMTKASDAFGPGGKTDAGHIDKPFGVTRNGEVTRVGPQPASDNRRKGATVDKKRVGAAKAAGEFGRENSKDTKSPATKPSPRPKKAPWRDKLGNWKGSVPGKPPAAAAPAPAAPVVAPPATTQPTLPHVDTMPKAPSAGGGGPKAKSSPAGKIGGVVGLFSKALTILGVYSEAKAVAKGEDITPHGVIEEVPGGKVITDISKLPEGFAAHATSPIYGSGFYEKKSGSVYLDGRAIYEPASMA